MPVNEQQRRALEERAAAEGVDPAALIAAAEDELGARDRGGDSGGDTPAAEPPKLFMYHLPFVRVREVRRRWLGLTESFPGDDAIASEWAAEHGGGNGAAAVAGSDTSEP